ncbi:ABC transporter ATP-binding protein/permease [Candidatus Pelagibacter sp.]|nr:ABC transporter ATP-binding protein/permease [Candidatus Pelagibacter sp.]
MYSSLLELLSNLSYQNKKKLLFIQFLIIIMSLFEVASIMVIAPFMGLVAGNIDADSSKFIFFIKDALDLTETNDLIFVTGFITLFLFIISSFFSILTLFISTYFGNKIGAELSTNLYNLFLSKPYLFHINNNSSDLTSKISFNAERTITIILRVLSTNSSLIKAISIVVALLIYNFKVALVLGLTFIIAYFFIYFGLQSKFNKIGNILTTQQSKLYKLMTEGFGSIKDIIVLSRGNFFVKEFRQSRNLIASKSAFITTMSLAPRPLIETVAMVTIISMILYFIKSTNDNVTSILSTLAVFGLGSYRLLPAFQDIYYNLSTIKGSLPAYKSISKYLKQSNYLKETANINNPILLKKNDVLEFENVNFFYDNNQAPSLNEIKIKINLNTTVGIVGQTGAGKSTFGNLILGILRPTSGSIKINDKKIDNDFEIQRWQKNISFVPQNLFLLETSIKNNIAFTLKDEDVDLDKIKKSCEMAKLSDFINSLDNKYDTMVGEKGIKLSGGQQQRIGIARAIYNDTSILFLDEATSALDGITEEKVINSIKKDNNKTIFLISHNFSTIKNCDKIIYFEKGRIVASGSYDELLKYSDFKKLSEVS